LVLFHGLVVCHSLPTVVVSLYIAALAHSLASICSPFVETHTFTFTQTSFLCWSASLIHFLFYT
jgi:hypothetical protein